MLKILSDGKKIAIIDEGNYCYVIKDFILNGLSTTIDSPAIELQDFGSPFKRYEKEISQIVRLDFSIIGREMTIEKDISFKEAEVKKYVKSVNEDMKKLKRYIEF